jgi:hypothetical protein
MILITIIFVIGCSLLVGIGYFAYKKLFPSTKERSTRTGVLNEHLSNSDKFVKEASTEIRQFRNSLEAHRTELGIIKGQIEELVISTRALAGVVNEVHRKEEPSSAKLSNSASIMSDLNAFLEDANISLARVDGGLYLNDKYKFKRLSVRQMDLSRLSDDGHQYLTEHSEGNILALNIGEQWIAIPRCDWRVTTSSMMTHRVGSVFSVEGEITAEPSTFRSIDRPAVLKFDHGRSQWSVVEKGIVHLSR